MNVNTKIFIKMWFCYLNYNIYNTIQYKYSLAYFREHVIGNLDKTVFNKPICEVMLDQKFFNGIGNYLRAEILYRCGVY